MIDIIHPEIKRLIGGAWNERPEDVSLREAAKRMGVSASALHSWINGKQKPQADKIQAITHHFYPVDKQQQERFAEELEQALNAKRQTVARDPLEQLVQGNRSIQIGVIDYERFASSREPGRKPAFFDSLFERFAAYAAISGKGIKFASKTLEEAIPAVCDFGTLDIVIGVLETPDRSKKVKFFPLPISIPVNGVILNPGATEKARIEYRNNVATALLGQPVGGIKTPEQHIMPIVNEKEVGGLHVTNFLEFNKTQYIARAYDTDIFAKTLAETTSNTKAGVVVADELMCAELVLKLRRDEKEAELVFYPRDNQGNDEQLSGLMPRYRLAFFVNREHKQLADYLADAFACFLDSNFELVARLYAHLCSDLESTFKAAFHPLDTKPTGSEPSPPRLWLNLGSRNMEHSYFYEVLSLVSGNPWPKILQKAHDILETTPSVNGTGEQQPKRKKRSK